MAKDFKASQIRTSQIIASGSVANKPSLVILSASSAGASDFSGGGISNIPATVGSDVFVFVSGSTNSFGTTTRGVTLFGGDIVVSGSLYNGTGGSYGNVAGSNKQIQFNDAGSFGANSGLIYDKNPQALSVGTLYVTGTSLNVSGSLTVAGNLTIKGTTTSVSSSNLTISDPIVYIASGSVGVGTKSAIAFASGSQTAPQSLIFGSSGASNILAAAKQDVQSGSLAQSSLSFTDLVPIQASSFLAGGTSAYVSSSNGSSLEIAASTQVLILSGGSSTSVNSRNFADTNFFVSGSVGSRNTTTRGTSVFGGDVTISGSLLSNDLFTTTGNVIGAPGSGANVLSLLSSGNIVAKLDVDNNAVGHKFDVQDYRGISQFFVGEDGNAQLSGSLFVSSSLVASSSSWFLNGLNVSGTTTVNKIAFGNNTYITSSDGSALSAAAFTSFDLSAGTISDFRIKAGPSFGTGGTGIFAVTASAVKIGSVVNQANLPDLPGSDTFFFVSGSVGGRNASTRGISVFGGDLYSSGVMHGASGISGSLTRLTDGTSYLIAGSNVTITTGSNGAVTISSTGGGGGGSTTVTGTFNDVTGKLSTTGTFAIAGSRGFNYFADSVGNDVNFFVSGTSGSKGTSTRGTSVFGGDLVVSGTVYGSTYLNVGQDLRVTGSIASNAYTLGSVLFAGNSGIITQDNANIFFDDTNNRLGLATTSPQQTLHVKGKTELEGGGVTANLADQIVFAASTVPTSYLHKLQTSHDSTVAINNKITFDMWNGSTNLPIFSMSGSGNSQFRGNLLVGGALTVTNGSGINAISGTTQFPQGLSGSLTKLVDGTSYLIAGTNVTITTGSSGAVTISSTGGGGTVTTGSFNEAGGSLITTASVSLAGTRGFAYSASTVGSDVYFFASGSTNAKDGTSPGVSVFGGQTVFSGSIFGGVNSFLGITAQDIIAQRVAIKGSNVAITLGSDTSFFVSGSVGSKSTSTRGTATFGGDVVTSGTIYPGTDLGSNLGSPTNRWGNIYTGDLHLKNDRGDYTLIEEEDCLTIRFNKTGKRYRFLLERAPEYDE